MSTAQELFKNHFDQQSKQNQVNGDDVSDDIDEVTDAVTNASSNEQAESVEEKDFDISLSDPIDSILDSSADEEPIEYDFGDISSSLDQDVLNTFKSISQELKLGNDQAKKIVDSVVPKLQEQSQRQFKQITDQWRKEASENAEINNPQSLGKIKKVISAYGDDAFKDLLDKSGLKANPTMLAFLKRIGDAISVESMPIGKASAKPAVQKSPAMQAFENYFNSQRK